MKEYIIYICAILSVAIAVYTFISQRQERILVSGIVADRFVDDGWFTKHYMLRIELNACEKRFYDKEVPYETYCEYPVGTYCSFKVKLKDVRE